KIGSLFIYTLVATIGMKMDLSKILENPGLLAVGLIWIGIHGILLIVVAKIIKAPFFFLAVGSQATVGGAATAPIVAAEFHPCLGGHSSGGIWLCDRHGRGILVRPVDGSGRNTVNYSRRLCIFAPLKKLG